MTWLRRLLQGRRMEQQLDKELRFHVEQQTADLVAQGLSSEEARRQARLALGGPEQVKEQCRDARGTRWLQDIFHDLRHALRMLRKQPGFSAVTICTLGLGIGAATVMFTVVKSVLLAPLAYPEPARLISVHVASDKLGDLWSSSYPDYLSVRDTARSFETVAAWSYTGFTLTQPGPPDHLDARVVSADLFRALRLPLALGREFLPEEDRPGAAPVAILSYRLWQERFGGSVAALGQKVTLDGTAYSVVGVAPASLRLDGEAGVLTPLGQNQLPRMRNRGARFIHVWARLARGASAAAAQAELASISRHVAETFPQTNADLRFVAHPLQDDVIGDIGPTLWLLLGAVGVVLLVACVNIGGLLLARAVSRGREMAVRVALGAGRGRLIRQCLTESAVLGLAGGGLGTLLAALGTPVFISFWPQEALPRAEEIRMDWRVLLFVAAVSLLCSLLFGVVPALRASLRGQTGGSRVVTGSRVVSGMGRWHGSFITLEVGLTLVLLMCAGLLGRTMLRLSALDPGFRLDNVLAARVAVAPEVQNNPTRARAAWEDLAQRVRRLPGVESAATVDIVPMRNGVNVLPYWSTPQPPPPNESPSALTTTATPEYLKVMRIKLLRGRFFEPQDRLESEPVVVIDEVMAKHAFPNQDPIGQHLTVPALSRLPVRVVGEVAHVRHWGLARDDSASIRDQMYCPLAQIPDVLMGFYSTIMSVVVRTSIPAANAVEPLRREIQGDQILYDAVTLQDVAEGSLAQQRFLLVLFGAFAGLALLLACIGIYGALAYLTRQRVPEIGVRMALGATSGNVLRMILRQSLAMILVGSVIGVAGAIAAGRLLQHLVAGAQPAGAGTYAMVLAVLLAAVLLASFLPARRASRVDPLNALRQE